MKTSLENHLHQVRENCVNCSLCVTECSFLTTCGTPGDIAGAFISGNNSSSKISFECSLCGLCTAVCPKGIDPVKMFLEMRRSEANDGNNNGCHKGIIAYERRGTSPRYSFCALPENCDTVFFPGCTLAGTRPDKTINVFQYLKRLIPNVGIALDCCAKPSHDLGRMDNFRGLFGVLKAFLLENQVKTVIVACPSCYKVFVEHGPEFDVKTVYTVMSGNGLVQSDSLSGQVTVHDPCPLRFETAEHEAVRNLVTSRGLTVSEMEHHGTTTLCCGEGGAVAGVSDINASSWRKKRHEEARNHMVVTYCAGCVNFLKNEMPAVHILDLMFEPEKALSGKAKISRAPFTYLNRYLLKKKMKKMVDAAVVWERGSSK